MMSESMASRPESFDAAQARALADLLELQALRENLWACPPTFPDAPRERKQAREEHEHALRAAHEQLTTSQQGYSDRYSLPSLSQSPLDRPAKLGAWCRLIVQVFQALGQNTEGVSCEHIMQKAARSATRILPREYVPAPPEGGLWSISLAINRLQVLAQRCEAMTSAGSEDGR